MPHDLREDAKLLRDYIAGRVQSFDAATNDIIGEAADPISLVHVGFEHEQGGYVAIVFDTRPGATPDGEWTMHIEAGHNWIEFPHWAEMTEAIFEDSELKVIDSTGQERIFKDEEPDNEEEDEYAAMYGEMIASEIQAAVDRQAFAVLPLADNCRIYIEQINGAYGWPEGRDLVEISP